MKAVLEPEGRAEYEQGMATARAQLDEEAFEKAWAEGQAMSMAQAIEDALILARCLRSDDVTSALRNYEASRIRRTAIISKLSQLVGRLAQMESPLACGLRDTVTRLTPTPVISM